jgi:ribosomal protein S27AE
MARRTRRPVPSRAVTLTPLATVCPRCGAGLWVADHRHRTVVTRDGLCRLPLVSRRGHTPTGPRYHVACLPEEEGHWVVPHGEFGLERIGRIGAWRFAEHRSVLEMHQRLVAHGVAIAERTVTHLVHRYEELVALHLADQHRLRERLQAQGRVILAIDGLQPDVGHEVLWIIRDCLSGEVLLARALLSSTQGDLAALLRAVPQTLVGWSVAIDGLVSDGQETIRTAVAAILPDIPHQRGRISRTNAASFPRCARRRGRSSRPIALPKRTASNRCGACGRLNA